MFLQAAILTSVNHSARDQQTEPHLMLLMHVHNNLITPNLMASLDLEEQDLIILLIIEIP